MKEDALIQISHQIKGRRKELDITLQELADKANVSKGLISQIENGRTVPSLAVLIDIVKGLDTDLNVFFSNITTNEDEPLVLIKRKETYEPFEKEDAAGFNYYRIFSKSIKQGTVDMVLLELEPGSSRPMVKTQAFEFKYVISGQVEYHIADDQFTLNEGDSILFDGRILHTPKNTGDTKVVMLVIYFFEEEHNHPSNLSIKT